MPIRYFQAEIWRGKTIFRGCQLPTGNRRERTTLFFRRRCQLVLRHSNARLKFCQTGTRQIAGFEEYDIVMHYCLPIMPVTLPDMSLEASSSACERCHQPPGQAR